MDKLTLRRMIEILRLKNDVDEPKINRGYGWNILQVNLGSILPIILEYNGHKSKQIWTRRTIRAFKYKCDSLHRRGLDRANLPAPASPASLHHLGSHQAALEHSQAIISILVLLGGTAVQSSTEQRHSSSATSETGC
jgi:hypothetical protein